MPTKQLVRVRDAAGQYDVVGPSTIGSGRFIPSTVHNWTGTDIGRNKPQQYYVTDYQGAGWTEHYAPKVVLGSCTPHVGRVDDKTGLGDVYVGDPALTQVWVRNYNDYQSYNGQAHEATVDWYGLPQPLDFEGLAESQLRSKIEGKGGITLQITFYQEPVSSVYGYSLLYHYRLVLDYYDAGSVQGNLVGIAPAAILGLIVAIIVIIAIAVILSEVRDILWGPGGKGGGNPWQALEYIAVAGVVLVGVGATVYFYNQFRHRNEGKWITR